MTLSADPRSVRLRFTVTIFAGSFLLFLVQPMVARMAMPRLGGAPAVWNSAMLVYQALLLCGYGYAHLLGRLKPRMQAAVHLFLLLAAALMLPIGLIASGPTIGMNPFLWTPWLFIASIGPLFFVISAQAPLLQRWFAVSGGGDPYPLYAASNLGSFGGLIAYPLIVEPLMSLGGQSKWWSLGYALVVLLVLACSLLLPKSETPEQAAAPAAPVKPVSGGRFAYWVALAAVPSGLMMSTTTHLTTDIVSMPLLWVVPLGLYLLSFSIAFAERRLGAEIALRIAPVLLLIAAVITFARANDWAFLYALLSVTILLGISTALHAMLYDRRPEPAQLTKFYFAMSVGGVVGGLFCGLIAPLVFDWGYEHPLLLVAAGLLLLPQPILPRFASWPTSRLVIVALVATVAALASGKMVPAAHYPAQILALVAGLIAVGRPLPFAMSMGAAMLAYGGFMTLNVSFKGGERVRSYFGVYQLGQTDDKIEMLIHGTTLHGMQDQKPGRSTVPISYYGAKSGVGLAIRAVQAEAKWPLHVGVVGLGSGTLSCYARPGDTWRFYEIDPAMAAIARNAKDFTYLSQCQPHADIAIGDARLSLAGDPPHQLNLLIVDAFSSDAIPMHLLTHEAMDVYDRRLAPGGVLMFHISNRFFDLEPVLAAAKQWSWTSSIRRYRVTKAEGDANNLSSDWVMLARDPATVKRLTDASGAANWEGLRSRPGFTGWSDDYASVLPLIRWSRRP